MKEARVSDCKHWRTVSHPHVTDTPALWLWGWGKLSRGFQGTNKCTLFESAGLTREQLGAFFKEPDVVAQVGDLLLHILHALLLVGPWRRAGGGHEHWPEHLLIGFTQRPAQMGPVWHWSYCCQSASRKSLTQYYLTNCSASSARTSSGQSLTLSSKTATTSSWVMKTAVVCLLRSWQK